MTAQFNRYRLSLVLYLARRFDAAVAEARAGAELEPNNHLPYLNLGWALGAQGRYDEAVEVLTQAATLVPGDLMAQMFAGWALALAGQRQEALAIRANLERRRTEAHFSSFFMAMISVGFGESDQAISWLRRAAEERDAMLTFLGTWPSLDPLRSDPRFEALLKPMNFPVQE